MLLKKFISHIFFYHHSKVLPALQVMAEFAISDANRTMSVPFADGRIVPSIMAILPAVCGDVAFDAVGIL